ncbi:hypothetical protein LJR090_000107 [Bosea sp. LjRoot90]|uniref:hypothetical protein n=1 Tax=Bosea sp. LjRoot90 TaxID=3342342 RepID=UPI003ECF3F0F
MFNELMLQLIPITVIGALFAWGNYSLAVKSGRNGWLFVILSCIPVIGLITMYYTLYSSISYALKRLPEEPRV